MKKIILILGIFYGLTVSAQITANAGKDFVMCNNDTTQFGAPTAASGGTGPYTYKWEAFYVVGATEFYASTFLNDTTLANPSIILELSNFQHLSFKLTVTDALNNTDSDSVTVNFSNYIYSLIDYFAFIHLGDSVQLSHTILGGHPPISYQWTPNYNLSDANTEHPWAKPDTTTSYLCIAIDSSGCRSKYMGELFEVYINSVSVDEYDINNTIKIYPNPSTNKLVVENLSKQLKDVTIEIRSLTGKLELLKKVNSFERTTLNTTKISAGIYFVSIKVDNNTITAKKWVKTE